MNETVLQIKQRIAKAQVNYGDNVRDFDDILIKERGYVSNIQKGSDVVVISSGGLDSSVMIEKIIEDWDAKVHPLFFRRGARAEKYEEKAFDFFVDFYSKRFPANMKDSFKLAYDIPPRIFKAGFSHNLSLTQGHPLRNSTMQNLAVMYAVYLQNMGTAVKTVLAGSIADDNTEPELGLLSLRAQTLNTCIQLGDWDWNISSPLIDPYLTERPLFKSDLIEYALTKFIPLGKTRSCFSDNEVADGTCIACKKRLEAFSSVDAKDPLEYKQNG